MRSRSRLVPVFCSGCVVLFFITLHDFICHPLFVALDSIVKHYIYKVHSFIATKCRSASYLNFGYLILSSTPSSPEMASDIHTTASLHTVVYQYEPQPSLYPCLKDKMPPDRGRASRACESCRKQKTRCYESGVSGRPCFRCERLRQRCSFVQTPPQPALGSPGGVSFDNTDARCVDFCRCKGP